MYGGANTAEDMLKQYGEFDAHATDIYPPPQVIQRVEEMHFILGLSLELTTIGPYDGLPWDFNNPAKAGTVRRYAQQQ